MNRKAIKLIGSTDGKRAVFIDKENAEEIYNYINQDERHKKKFQFIVGIILSGLRNTECYDHENFNTKTRGVTAMKFFKGQENDRIYCKEYRKDGKTFIIIVSELLQKKKTRKLSQREKNIIKKVADYHYELEE